MEPRFSYYSFIVIADDAMHLEVKFFVAVLALLVNIYSPSRVRECGSANHVAAKVKFMLIIIMLLHCILDAVGSEK